MTGLSGNQSQQSGYLAKLSGLVHILLDTFGSLFGNITVSNPTLLLSDTDHVF